MPAPFKSVSFGPMTGLLDVRSLPAEMPPGAFRWKQNFQVTTDNRLCRRPGWSKLLSTETPFVNQDLHDQLLPMQFRYEDFTPPAAGADTSTVYPPGAFCGPLRLPAGGREPVTLIWMSTDMNGARTLFAATRSTIYRLNESTGGWAIIADGLGSGLGLFRRFRVAELRDYVFFTNNADEILVHQLGQLPQGCKVWRAAPMPELQELKVTQAGVVIEFNGFMLLMDTVEDGQRFQSRVRWSDINEPAKWKTAVDRLSSFQDLDYGDHIIAARELANYLIIYTTRSIWRMYVQGGDRTFGFQRVYLERENRDKCLAYPHTLVSTGASHYYAGLDGIYEFNNYLSEPDRVEWLHRGTGVLFDTVDEGCCDGNVAGYHPADKELWFSFAPNGNACHPARTLVANVRAKTCDVVEFGFSAFGNFISDKQQSLRDWMLEYCLCDTAELQALGAGYIKESLPYCGGNPGAAQACEQEFTPASLHTEQSVMVDGRPVENPAGQPSSTSLCALLGNLRIDDLCGECNTRQVFIGAAVEDFCLKEIGAGFNRERCTNPSATGVLFGWGNPAVAPSYSPSCGAYVFDGYYSILRGTWSLGSPTQRKTVNQLFTDVLAMAQTDPARLEMKLGTSYRAVDLNAAAGYCSVIWSALPPKRLRCPDTLTAAQFKGRGQVPGGPDFTWQVLLQGHYIHFELRIANKDGTPALGGAACFSSLITNALLENTG